MTTVADPENIEPKKKSKLPLLLGIVLAILGGGGGFAAVQFGLIGGESHSESGAKADGPPAEPLPSVAYVPLDPLIISIPSAAGRSFLKFSAQIEVRPQYAADVEVLKPRIVDVLNSYLRAVDASELEDPAALVKIRAQMLRRLQIVVGEGRITDLLIMEFVLN